MATAGAGEEGYFVPPTKGTSPTQVRGGQKTSETGSLVFHCECFAWLRSTDTYSTDHR